MGPTRMLLDKPVIAAVEGYAVAGGLELALWCDLRVAASDAVFGVFCRRWGVPLVDGGTIRLPRIDRALGPALDLIITGRGVSGEEAQRIGPREPARASRAPRSTPHATLAHEIAALPQRCLRTDRRSRYEQWDAAARRRAAQRVPARPHVLEAGDAVAGASRFAAGAGRHGDAAR